MTFIKKPGVGAQNTLLLNVFYSLRPIFSQSWRILPRGFPLFFSTVPPPSSSLPSRVLLLLLLLLGSPGKLGARGTFLFLPFSLLPPFPGNVVGPAHAKASDSEQAALERSASLNYCTAGGGALHQLMDKQYVAKSLFLKKKTRNVNLLVKGEYGTRLYRRIHFVFLRARKM